MIAVSVDAWRVNQQSESLEELQRSERESRGTVRCGMGETIDDALASRRAVPVSLEPFEGEGRTGTVAQEPFEPCTVTARDMDRGIDAEPAGGLPSEHVIGDVAFEQTVTVEGTGFRARMSERSPNGPQEDAQHSAGDRGVVVQEGSDAGHRAKRGRNGEHPLAHGKRRQDVIDEVGGGLDHAASVAGGTHAAALATERDQEIVTTAGAAGASEAVRQNAATQGAPREAWSRKSRSTHEGTPSPMGSPSAACARNVSRWCWTRG